MPVPPGLSSFGLGELGTAGGVGLDGGVPVALEEPTAAVIASFDTPSWPAGPLPETVGGRHPHHVGAHRKREVGLILILESEGE